MKEKKKLTFSSRILAYVIRFVLRAILFTCKFKVKGKEHLLNLSDDKPYIIMLWHNRLSLIGPSILKSGCPRIFTAFASNSRDGDIVAAYTTSYKRGRAVRVPHNQKDMALKELIERLKNEKEIAIITPDGPRGPVYKLKPGVVKAALEASASVIPFRWESNKYYSIKSWDCFRIPLPFTTIEAEFDTPITLSKENSFDDQITYLEKRLNFE